MHPAVKIFRDEMINCIVDMTDIMESGLFSGDESAQKLVSELKVAKTFLQPLGENGIIQIMDAFFKCTIPLKERIETRDRGFFEEITVCDYCNDPDSESDCICETKCKDVCDCSESCTNCSEILKELDSKTFKAIKMVMKKGEPDDVNVAFEYIDCFIAACEKFRKDTKEKLN